MSISERERIHPHTPRLRAMIESWERDGLIGPDVAAQALTPEREQRDLGARPPKRRGPLLWLGSLVAVRGGAIWPMRAAGPKTHEVVLNDRSVRQAVGSR
jgi:hypothetical protein